MLAMSHHAFDRGYQTPDRSIPIAVTAVFAEYHRQFDAWLRGVGDAPAWEAVRAEASADEVQAMALTGVLGAAAAQPTAAQRAQAERERAAEAERERAAAAQAAGAPADAP